MVSGDPNALPDSQCTKQIGDELLEEMFINQIFIPNVQYREARSDDFILPSRVASHRFDRVEFLSLILQPDTLFREANVDASLPYGGCNGVVQGDGAKAKTTLSGRQGNEHGQNGFHGGIR